MIFINLDIGEIKDLLEIKESARKVAKDAANQLATAIHGKILQLGKERLKSRHKLFVDNVSMFEADDDVFIISLAGKYRWIDDGLRPHNMLDDLLASDKAKVSANGEKYVNVPFNHGPGKGEGSTAPGQRDLVTALQSEMKKRKIPFGKIERDEKGEAKLGRLHKFDVMTKPIKTKKAPWMGKGPVGDVRQGQSGIPLLQGVSVYQSESKDASGKSKTKRSIMTFRVASDSQRGTGRWDHPGTEKQNIFEDAVEWAREEWSSKIEPALREALIAEMRG